MPDCATALSSELLDGGSSLSACGFHTPFTVELSLHPPSATLAGALPGCLAISTLSFVSRPKVGEPQIKSKLLQGYDAAGKTFGVHLDGYDQRDLLARKGPNKRREFFYWTDDGNLNGLRYEQWKAVFLEQRAHGFDVWAEPMVQLRLPRLFNLRSDPFERAQHEAGDYVRWFVEHAFVLVPAQSLVAQHLVSFQQFPPRQKPGSFSVEQAMEKLRNPPSSN